MLVDIMLLYDERGRVIVWSSWGTLAGARKNISNMIKHLRGCGYEVRYLRHFDNEFSGMLEVEVLVMSSDVEEVARALSKPPCSNRGVTGNE